jgi:EmrB/QacA subfamily drug resistance transporter
MTVLSEPREPTRLGLAENARARRNWRGNPTLTLVAVALGVMMVALDGTIVAVANPSIQSHLHASLADIQWIMNGYMLALAVTLITIGKVGDRFGHKKVFVTGMVGFALFSAGIGLSGDTAKSISLVIAFRVAQGVFGAMLMPTALAILRETFPVDKLNAALGIWAGVIGASTAAGPIVGGFLVQHINWESCFYVNVIVGAVALAMTLLFVLETAPSKAARSFDFAGIALLSAGLFSLIWALMKASTYGWGSARTIGFFVGSAVALALFALCETRAAQPLLPLRLFRSVSLSVGTVLNILLMFSLVGSLFFMTFFMQDVHGLDPVMTGIRMLPLTGTLIIASPVAGLLIQKVGPRLPMSGGLVVTAAGLFGLSRLGAVSGPNDAILWFILLGLGLSPVMVGCADVVVGSAPVELAGVAGGMTTTAMQVGGVLGTSVLGAVMSAKVAHLLPLRWAEAHLPALMGQQLVEAKSVVSVGVAPVAPGTPHQVAAVITSIAHSTFMSGLDAAFLIASIAALAAAAVALLIKPNLAVMEVAEVLGVVEVADRTFLEAAGDL